MLSGRFPGVPQISADPCHQACREIEDAIIGNPAHSTSQTKVYPMTCVLDRGHVQAPDLQPVDASGSDQRKQLNG